MSGVASDVLQMVLLLAAVLLAAWPLGRYMARVFQGERTFLDPVLRPLERGLYRLFGLNASREMSWKTYAWAVIAFNAVGMAVLFVLQLVQGWLPFNPQHFSAVRWDTALNTAASFITNTNWQSYSGESTMSYFTQMAGLTVQNFLSGATGVAVLIALIRGLVRRRASAIGNFWVDMTRCTLWVLLPLSLVVSLVLVSQGVIQNLHPYVTVQTVEGVNQTLAMGPVASQEAIKMLGTNGGGFFGANSAHPFENPTPLSDLVEIWSIIVIPAALVFTFGRMIGKPRQGAAILGAMLFLLVVALAGNYISERMGNPLLAQMGVQAPTAMEGKEVRFGLGQSSLFSVVTTAVACGAVNNMHDSLTPLGGMVPMLLMMLGEVVFGGEGSGLYGMLVFAILAVFLVGLMVGRTPEFLGKKIESREVKLATLAGVIIPSATILIGAAISVVTPAGLASLGNPGPHGLSEVLYGFASGVGNNGSAFAGLNANTPYYNLMIAAAMLIGRFGVIVPVLGIAGSLAEKNKVPEGPGTFRTDTPLFSVLLSVTIVLVVALTFFPSLALGPIVEHIMMWQGMAA
ncbi:potassium-transporting ATPase subunit KdpA [Kyrpidia tusciae]|uniref:Potassium-transporting ATPase potassium-binding subunit n=1 Tax=Kyrpidia tusciae (strain DSM 2912 / NBRC 15312 / T2) TaxID=562970 RepID=D5WU10_KYRT2|nr:potassium-transporting ATPase subunit KdpA [Kyrpidia tusciae]ADG05330.1 potassium-transporting ATPase, A subunit [Kyrpidia tusciae DSM 2912]